MNVLMALMVTAQVSGLAGLWKKDPSRSDDARQKMQAAFQQMRGEVGHGGGMHGGGMRGGGMRGGGRGQGGRGPGGGQEGMGPMGPSGMVTAADELTLALEGNELHVVDGTRTRVYTLDGEKHDSETPNGGKLETTAQQAGNAISIEEKMSRGKVDRKFEVSPDGETLIVTSTVQLGSMKEPVVVRSVYVRPPAQS